MARFSLSFLSLFLVLAVLALSVPVKREELNPDQKLSLESALQDVKSATKMINGFDDKDTNDQKNQVDKAQDHSKSDGEKPESEKKVDAPTPTATETGKKKTSGNFATPTATHTSKPTSQPNALGKIPIVGGLLGGTGGL